jgi:hypothetical protein
MRKRFHPAFGAAIRIGLSTTGVAILRTGGWGKSATILADHPLAEDAVQTPARLALQCTTILADADCAGLPLSVTVGDEWARLFMVTPPHNSGRLQDFHGAAAMRFEALYGEGMGDWLVQADWQAREPFLACALPCSLLETLRQVAHDRALHLMSVMPQFAVVWNTWNRKLDSGAWFGLVHEHKLTLGAIAPAPRPRLCAVRAMPIPSDGDNPRWLAEQVARAALRLDLPAPSRLQLAGNRQRYWSDAGGTLALRNLDEPAAAGTAPLPPLSAAVALARSGMRA